MENEKTGKRMERRRKRLERRRIEQEQIKTEAEKNRRIELFIKIGIICLLAFIVVDFFISMYPIFMSKPMSFELSAVTFFVMQGVGIGFGVGLYFAGKRMTRDTGIYGGVFQIDGSIIAIINISIFLIANPVRYTQADVIVNSLYFGIDAVSSISLLIFGIFIAFFFLLIGTNSRKHLLSATGLLWFIELFLPAFTPSPYVDPVFYSVTVGFSWAVYGLTAFCFWKILYEYEALKAPKIPTYRIK
ncbi:MAG: hypothetical protein ACFFD2_11955 [Promethearchaeota archaeon]